MEADNGPTQAASLSVENSDELQNNTSNESKVAVSVPKPTDSNTIKKLVDDLETETGSVSAQNAKSEIEEVDSVQPVAAAPEDSATKATDSIEAMEVEDSSSNEVEMTDLSASESALEKKGNNDAVSSTVPSSEPESKTEPEGKTTITESVDVPHTEESKSDILSATPSTKTSSTEDTVDDAGKGKSDTIDKEVAIDAKYQDVEKNISSLFNGDDCAVDKQNPTKLTVATTDKIVLADSNRSLNNGTNIDGTKSSDESAKDLVSILEDDKVSAKDGDAVDSEKVEVKVPNNIVKNGGGPLSGTSAQTVFNSTPIQKQFDVSSEDVSTITLATNTDNSIQEPPSADTSAINKSLDICSSTATGSDGSSATDDTLTKFAKVIRNYNGITDTTDSGTSKLTASPSIVTSTADEQAYEVNIWYSGTELLCFSGDRIDPTASLFPSDVSEKVSSSIGSVTSLGEPFPLPSRMTITSGNSNVSGKSDECSDVKSNTTKVKQTIVGTVELCKFVIEHFQKLGRSLTDDKSFATGGSEHTPVTGRRGRGVISKESALTPIPANKRKRGDVIVLDDEESTPAKKNKKEPSTPTVRIEDDYPKQVVLARWTDKKYYAGRVLDKKSNNKYTILFEDGKKKILTPDCIVFGDKDTLPLLEEIVHALVDDDTYEPGLVQAVEVKDDTTYYKVLCESKTVSVTALDIFLEEEQAKTILAKQQSNVVNEPEPGSSGTVSTRKDRRQKRTEFRPGTGISESDVSDNFDTDSSPTSPKHTPVEAIVLVHGVQPELQITQKERENDKLRFLIENFGTEFRSVNLDDILGPINNTALFRNKGFLLTCTIPIKSPRITSQINGHNVRNDHIFDLSNRSMHFSARPFLKHRLQQQIESAGGTVYNHFEEIPRKKWRTCILLAPFPCLTAAYIQCLAANIAAVSHEWLIECCEKDILLKKDKYALPSGWSMVDNSYRLWTIGRRENQRKTNNPFNKITIIITSQQKDFADFWSRVCRNAGAKICTVKSKNDFTATLQGYILIDDEFPQEYRSIAEHFHIPIVSTVWVVQSLIVGHVCDPSTHELLTQLYDDDNI